MNQEKTRVPILPGFTIFTNIKNSLFQLSISVSDEQKILFSWINFGEIENDLYNLSNVVASNSGSDRFQSLLTLVEGHCSPISLVLIYPELHKYW